MDADSKKKIQLVLLLAILAAALRTAYILYERHEARTEQATSQPTALNPDYYITPRKLRPYDLQSARALSQQPVWVKEGYRYTYYPFTKTTKRTDFSTEAGLLLPLERLQIVDVVSDRSPKSADQRQLMAVFAKEGKTYAVPIGSERDGNYQLYSDEIFFVQDPRDLYKHWSKEVWDAIEKHELKPGMNELQADFAVGFGILEQSGDPGVRVLRYPNGGRTLVVTYRDGKAQDIKPAA
jgi:hypothetical protein